MSEAKGLASLPQKNILVRIEDNIAWVTLNRPAKRNAINPGIVFEMNQVLDVLEYEDEAKVLVLTGSGESFSAGMDLKEYFREPDAGHPVDRERLNRANSAWQWRRLMYYSKPTIAMVNGWCFGGAFQFLCACDLAGGLHHPGGWRSQSAEDHHDDKADDDERADGEHAEDEQEDDKDDGKPPLYKRPVFWIVVGVVAAVLIVGGVLYYLHSRKYQSTDDAFVDAHVVRIAAETTGRLSEVVELDNQQVRAGQILAVIEPGTPTTTLREAQAGVAESEAPGRSDVAENDAVTPSEYCVDTAAGGGVTCRPATVPAETVSAVSAAVVPVKRPPMLTFTW